MMRPPRRTDGPRRSDGRGGGPPSGRGPGKGRPPQRARKGPKKLSGTTLAEHAYWNRVIEAKMRIRATLKTRDEVEGTVEYFDSNFIRLTREGEPNLFLYKGDILYVAELGDA
ncbi:MAG: hypothetical protein GC160_29560 [Acidobacteria bacterium]|nr:hypothetical protein [Acidobacteriota bacterium]